MRITSLLIVTMKAILNASALAAAIVLVTSCYGPGAPPAPTGARGPRGYTLDKPPGRYGEASQNPGGPQDTRYLDPQGADPSAANVQPPAPDTPPLPAGGSPAPTAPPSGTTEPGAPIVVTPPGITTQPTTPETKPVVPPSGGYPTAKRTRPGYVESPFAAGREVDVQGMRSGAKARCPYTQKVFIVP